MSSDPDIRYRQRFANFQKASSKLHAAINLANSRDLTELEVQGLVKAFEFTYELAWNLLRDYFIFQGSNSITGSRDAFREGLNKGLIRNDENWFNMITDRNQSTQVYNQETALEIAGRVKDLYARLFEELEEKFSSL
jgi:nucleotidyltransferase substrate binding protein (TIGR01987 family)